MVKVVIMLDATQDENLILSESEKCVIQEKKVLSSFILEQACITV